MRYRVCSTFEYYCPCFDDSRNVCNLGFTFESADECEGNVVSFDCKFKKIILDDGIMDAAIKEYNRQGAA